MNIDIKTLSIDPLDDDVDLLGLLCHEGAFEQDAHFLKIDALLEGLLRRVLADERFLAKPGQTLVLHTHGRLKSHRVALVGLGPLATRTPATLRIGAGRFARLAASVGARTVGLTIPQDRESATKGGPPHAEIKFRPDLLLQAAAEGLLLGLYRFDKYLDPSKRPPTAVQSAHLFAVGGADDAAVVVRAFETARAVATARNLVNEPAGVLTPETFCQIVEPLAKEAGIDITVLGPEACRQRGMGLFLAVAQGSAQEPRFLHLAWKPPAAKKKVVLIGKGVTFDSGGLSLKTNEGMLDMKVDMSGAAAVMAAIEAVARQQLPVEVHAIAACTENMPSGTAYKLGDVLRSMAGKTVEINNTDAEGRLTLADALTYSLELKPDLILDFATLTGACVVALGPHIAGVMGNSDELVARWLTAARDAGEEMWHLPLPDRLADQLKSEIADLKNTGERWGGALTAGLFLKEFVDATPWIHVDLAGPASTDKELGHISKGGTGFGVATILQFLRGLTR